MLSIGLSLTGQLRSSVTVFSPVSLFAASEPGVWYDPSDLTTMFTDTAGTTPVTTPGQTVARINDKSGRGNNATQATTASRPTYGIVPLGGRRNLLLLTENFSDAYYTKTNITLGSSVSDPNGGTAAFTLTSTAANASISRTIGSLNTGGTISCFVRRRTGSGSVALWNGTGYSNITVTGSWVRVSVSQVTTTTGFFDMRLAVSGDAVDVAFPQVEAGTLSAYQRVGTTFDVTESGVQSLSYLAFDGVDDFLVTPTITPGIDKAQVFAGVRKLSDITQGIVAELSVDNNTQNGSLIFNTGTSTTAGPNYCSGSRGSAPVAVNQFANSTASFSSPITNVITATHDIAGDLSALRVNGTANGANGTGDKGTGNFLAYPIYLGRRASGVAPFNGQIYSMIVRFGANLDAGTIISTETFVGDKTDINIANNISTTIFARDDTAVLDRFSQTIERRA